MGPFFVSRSYFILAFLFALEVSLFAQENFPVLTRTITFEKLLRYASTRDLVWTNPNGVQEKMSITEMSIPIDQKMMQLTLGFVISNYGLNSVWLQPRVIVFHAMGDGDLKTSLEVSSFLNDQIPESWGNLYKAGLLPNGAHFIIDKDGKIICLTPPVSSDGSRISYKKENHKWIIKRHQDGNPVAIGIENVTDRGNFTMLTDKQIESNARLARWLIWMEDNKIDYLTSHHQYNDDSNYEFFLKAFNLKHLQLPYRTRGRRDIGDPNVRKIIEKVNRTGYFIHSFFELK